MPSTPDPTRWRDAGKNEAGDQMYVRHVGGAVSAYREMSKADLAALAEKNSLAKSGTKDVLIARLVAAGIDL